jgi:hypothetical protein
MTNKRKRQSYLRQSVRRNSSSKKRSIQLSTTPYRTRSGRKTGKKYIIQSRKCHLDIERPNDADVALTYLLERVSQYEPSRMCMGIQDEVSKWFEHLDLTHEISSPVVISNEMKIMTLAQFSNQNNKVNSEQSVLGDTLSDVVDILNFYPHTNILIPVSRRILTKQIKTKEPSQQKQSSWLSKLLKEVVFGSNNKLDSKTNSQKENLNLATLLKEGDDELLRSLETSGHANMLFINRKLKTIEWFEPHGVYDDSKAKTPQIRAEWTDFRNWIFRELKFILDLPNYSIDEPYEECGLFGPQARAKEDKKCPIGGFCVTYSTIYAHLRILAPGSSSQETVKSLQKLSPSQNLDLVQRYIRWQETAPLKRHKLVRDEFSATELMERGFITGPILSFDTVLQANTIPGLTNDILKQLHKKKIETIDDLYNVIKNSKSVTKLREWLLNDLELDNIQTEEIIALSKLLRQKIIENKKRH